MYPLTGWMILSLTPQFEQGNSNTSAAYQKNLASLKMILIFWLQCVSASLPAYSFWFCSSSRLLLKKRNWNWNWAWSKSCVPVKPWFSTKRAHKFLFYSKTKSRLVRIPRHKSGYPEKMKRLSWVPDRFLDWIISLRTRPRFLCWPVKDNLGWLRENLPLSLWDKKERGAIGLKSGPWLRW